MGPFASMMLRAFYSAPALAARTTSRGVARVQAMQMSSGALRRSVEEEKRYGGLSTAAHVKPHDSIDELSSKLNDGDRVKVVGIGGNIQGIVTKEDLNNSINGKGQVVGRRGALRREDSVVGDILERKME